MSEIRPPIDQAWPPQQQYPPLPLPQPPAPAARRRWPVFVGGVAIGAAIAAAITAALTAGTRENTATRTPVTITATPPAPTTPAPLPAAEANRHTCDAWVAAGDLIHDASRAQSAIPQGMTILDPAVRANPDWSAAVQRAADQYKQAGDKLTSGVAPGTTTILDQTARATAAGLTTLATAYSTFDGANGNAYHVVKESSDTMDVLCNRLAPR